MRGAPGWGFMETDGNVRFFMSGKTTGLTEEKISLK
nr:MAG TPA: hypothetical protein [Caudoviricetes sp.]